MKRVVIVGASSGLGASIARRFIDMGWIVGLAARRIEPLESLKASASDPERVYTAQIDVTCDAASDQLLALFERMGGVDIYLHSSGIGKQNVALDPAIEIATLRTNGEGFVRMMSCAFNYFKERGGGHIAAISSVAGTRGLGASAAYSATKRMQRHYIDSLAQLSNMEGYNISLTDIRPGFVATPLLSGDRYPLLMEVEQISKQIVRAVLAQKRVATLDWRYAVMCVFWRAIPQWLWERMVVKSRRS